MNKKGNITLYLVFIFLAMIIITIGALVGPLGVLFSTDMFVAGEGILMNANESLQQIQDEEIKNKIYTIVDDAQEATTTNIQVSGALFEYSWLFLLIITLIVVFIFTRRLVEVGNSGGLI